MSNVQKHLGSCHCQAVRFEVTVDPMAGGTRCNCSVCAKLGQLGNIVKPDAFKLLQGDADLTTYEWGSKMGKRFFCKHCGITCFGKGHLEQLGGDYVSVNFNTLEGVELAEIPTKHWDGRHDNWQAGPRETPWPMYTPPPV